MLLHNIHEVTLMLAETMKHCTVEMQTMDLLFPERMLLVEEGEEYVLLK